MHPNELEVGATHTLTSDPITTTQLVKYAGASGDFNRIHFDEPFARENGLKGVLAHGMLTMAIAGRCVEEVASHTARIPEFSSQFLAPVWVGDTVSVTATVVEKQQAQLRLEVEASAADKIVLKGKALIAFESAAA